MAMSVTPSAAARAFVRRLQAVAKTARRLAATLAQPAYQLVQRRAHPDELHDADEPITAGKKAENECR